MTRAKRKAQILLQERRDMQYAECQACDCGSNSCEGYCSLNFTPEELEDGTEDAKGE